MVDQHAAGRHLLDHPLASVARFGEQVHRERLGPRVDETYCVVEGLDISGPSGSGSTTTVGCMRKLDASQAPRTVTLPSARRGYHCGRCGQAAQRTARLKRPTPRGAPYSLNPAFCAAERSVISVHCAATSCTEGGLSKLTPSFWNSAARCTLPPPTMKTDALSAHSSVHR